MQVDVRTAAERLPSLVDAALAGEEIVIVNGAVPLVRLVPASPSGRAGPFRLNIMKDRLPSAAPDFLEPLEDGELDRWEGRR